MCCRPPCCSPCCPPGCCPPGMKAKCGPHGPCNPRCGPCRPCCAPPIGPEEKRNGLQKCSPYGLARGGFCC